jgi:DNA polymerase-3 subunit delta
LIHLIKGKEEFLRSRARKEVVARALKSAPDTPVIEMSAKNYAKGRLAEALSPSLLSPSSVVVVDDAESYATDDFPLDVLKLVEQAQAGSFEGTLILQHTGVVKGKKFITAIEGLTKQKKAEIHPAEEIKRDDQKQAFVAAEFRKHKMSVANDGAAMLVQYVGDNLGELVGYVNQLAGDAPEGTATISKDYINQYFQGLQQVDVFEIINAAVAGNLGRSLALLRHAYEQGESPASLIPRFVVKIRQIGKVAGAKRLGLGPADLKMSPWQVTNVQKESRDFTSTRLANSVQGLAAADVAAKGGSLDAGRYELERALTAIANR